MPPPEFNWEEAHQSERTAYAVKIMSAFGNATTVFKEKGNGGVYEYATYLHSRIYDVESSGAKLRYVHLMTSMAQTLSTKHTKYVELNGFMIDIAHVDPHERMQLMLMEIMSISDQIDIEATGLGKPPTTINTMTGEQATSPSPTANDTTSTMA